MSKVLGIASRDGALRARAHNADLCGRYQECLDALEGLSRPRAADVALQIVALVKTGNFPGAERRFDSAIAEFPSTEHREFFSTVLLHRTPILAPECSRLALRCLENSLHAISATDPDDLPRLIDIADQMGSADQSIALRMRLVKMGRASGAMVLDTAQRCWEQGQKGQARELLSNHYPDGAQESAASLLKAEISLDEHDWSTANEHFAQAGMFAGQRLAVVALSQLHQHQFGDAIHTLDQIDADGVRLVGLGSYQLLRARAALGIGDKGAAVSAMATALEAAYHGSDDGVMLQVMPVLGSVHSGATFRCLRRVCVEVLAEVRLFPSGWRSQYGWTKRVERIAMVLERDLGFLDPRTPINPPATRTSQLDALVASGAVADAVGVYISDYSMGIVYPLPAIPVTPENQAERMRALDVMRRGLSSRLLRHPFMDALAARLKGGTVTQIGDGTFGGNVTPLF